MEMANVMMTKVHMTTGPQMCVTTCCNMKNSRCERGEERRPFLPSPLYHAVSTFLHYRSNALFPSHSFRHVRARSASLHESPLRRRLRGSYNLVELRPAAA